MTTRKVEYTANGGLAATVKLDGEDISEVVTSLCIIHDAGELPSIEIRLGSLPAVVDIMEGRIRVDASTHMVLKKLGWTPPTDPWESRGEVARRRLAQGK